MGNDTSKIAGETGLVEWEVKRLHEKYDMLSRADALDAKSAKLDEGLFVSKFPDSQEQLAHLIFHAMDIEETGFIDFREYCVAVAVLSKGSADEKMEFAFNLYDTGNKGFISLEDLDQMVTIFRASSKRLISKLKEAEGAEEDDALAASHLFNSMNPDTNGRVSKEEFFNFCRRNPEMFEQIGAAFNALKRASYWDWDRNPAEGTKPSVLPSDCSVM